MKLAKPYPRKGQMIDGYDYHAPIAFNDRGWLSAGHFPADCVAECSASGAVDEAVAYWDRKLGFTAAVATVRPRAERYLKEFGAWDDLATADDETLAHRVLWLACCDIREQGEWLGLVH